jgi:hypothetical protein
MQARPLRPHEGKEENFFLDILFYRMSVTACFRQLPKRFRYADFCNSITEAGTASPPPIIIREVLRRREHRAEVLLQFPPTARTPR